jgi:Tfp pilus assembly protein PilE
MFMDFLWSTKGFGLLILSVIVFVLAFLAFTTYKTVGFTDTRQAAVAAAVQGQAVTAAQAVVTQAQAALAAVQAIGAPGQPAQAAAQAAAQTAVTQAQTALAAVLAAQPTPTPQSARQLQLGAMLLIVAFLLLGGALTLITLDSAAKTPFQQLVEGTAGSKIIRSHAKPFGIEMDLNAKGKDLDEEPVLGWKNIAVEAAKNQGLGDIDVKKICTVNVVSLDGRRIDRYDMHLDAVIKGEEASGTLHCPNRLSRQESAAWAESILLRYGKPGIVPSYDSISTPGYVPNGTPPPAFPAFEKDKKP